MTLADAIRLGSAQHPQAFGGYYEHNGGDVTAVCAVGAAMLVWGIFHTRTGKLRRPSVVEDHVHEVFAHYDLFKARGSACPQVGCEAFLNTRLCLIAHLNDDHKWSREAIADWLDEHRDGVPCVDGATPNVQHLKTKARRAA